MASVAAFCSSVPIPNHFNIPFIISIANDAIRIIVPIKGIIFNKAVPNPLAANPAPKNAPLSNARVNLKPLVTKLRAVVEVIAVN